MGWQLGRDPDNYLMWHSSQQKEGQYNFCGYANPLVDRWLVEARETFDVAKRKLLYHQIHAQIASDLPYIFLYCPDELVAIHKRFQGPEVAPLRPGLELCEVVGSARRAARIKREMTPWLPSPPSSRAPSPLSRGEIHLSDLLPSPYLRRGVRRMRVL